MVELNRNTFNQRLPRDRTVRSGGGGAQLPVRAPVDPTGRALQSVGQNVQRLGQVIGQIERRRDALDAQFRRAQEDIQGTEAASGLLDRMQARATQIQNDPQVLPMDKAGVFDEEFGRAVEQLSGELPQSVQAGFIRTTGSARRQLLRDLNNEGRKETVARAHQAFSTFKGQIVDALVGSESDVESLQLLNDLTEEGARYVRNGLISREALEGELGKVQDDVAIMRMEGVIALNPDAALAQLELGAAENSSIPSEAFVPLLRKAQDGAQEAFVLAQREEAAAIRQSDRASRDTRIQHIEQMVLDRDNIRGIKALMAGAVTAREAGRLSAQDAEAVQRFGFTLLDDRTDEQRTQTQPAVLQDYFRLLLDDPEEAQEFVIDHTGNGIAVGSATGLLNNARSATEANHFRNLPETRDAIAFVEAQLSTTGDPLLDAAISVDLSSVRADAVREMMTRVMGIAGENGLDKEAVLQALPAIRDQITQTHRARLKAIIEGQPQQVGGPQTQSVKDAVKQWRHMIQSGVPKYEADAFLGRELKRHTALSAEGDRLINAEGVAAELQEALTPIREVIP